MATKKKSPVKAKTKKISLKLNAAQIESLAKVFGPDVAKRVKTVQVEQVVGFLKSDLKVN